MQVVEEDDPARPEPCLRGPQDQAWSCPRTRVAGIDAPADVQEPKRTRDAILRRSCLPVRGPKDLWDGADGAADDALRPLELLPDVERRQTTEMRVAPGVISDGADRARGPCTGGPDSNPAPDEEERGPRSLLAQHAHEPERVRARAVVEGERHVPATRPRAVDGLRRVHQLLQDRELVDGRKPEDTGEHEPDEVH